MGEMVKGSPVEVTPEGFVTVTVAVPVVATSAAEMEAVSWVELT